MNSNKISYASGKLCAAVSSMATDSGNLKERLLNAHSILHSLTEKDFPNEFNEEWNSIYKSLTTYKQSSVKGIVYETIERMSDTECEEIIDKICNLSFEMIK